MTDLEGQIHPNPQRTPIERKRVHRAPVELNVFKECTRFKCLYANADSLLNKKKELEVEIHSWEEKPWVIAITEVLPKNYSYPITMAELSICGYELFTNTDSDSDGRGINIYIKEGIRVALSDYPETNLFKEAVWLEIPLNNHDNLLLGCIYRSPNSTPENNDKLNHLIGSLDTNRFSHILILGDFNYKEINWLRNCCDTSEDHPAYKFLEATRECYLFQHVTKPTRYRQNQTPSTLDLIFTSEEGMISELDITTHLGKSDHCMIKFDFNISLNIKEQRRICYRYDKGDYIKMRNLLNQHPWELDGKTTEEAWTILNSNIDKAKEECIPKKIITPGRKQKPLWMDQKTMDKVKKKHRAWNKYTRTKEHADYNAYVRARNQARWATRNAVKIFEKAIAKEIKSNPKSFWKYTNSKLKTKTGIAELDTSVPGQRTRNDEEKACELSKFFEEVFTREDVTEIPSINVIPNPPNLENIDFEAEEVLKKLNALKIGKSPGPDGNHPRVLKEIAQAINEPLSILYNMTMSQGNIPHEWKRAHITPIFKKGNRHAAANYRPVSLTSIICKIQESIIRDKLVDHMKQNHLFADEQYGFIAGRSCITQLLEVLDEWTAILDGGGSLDAVYMDFMKAFDTVPHERLLSKLQSYGIKGKLHAWMRNFLIGRKQRVLVNGAASEWADVRSGIPQGSILGPILFVIFINDIPDVVDCGIRLFADDTKAFKQIHTTDDCKKLQHNINSLQDWAEKWNMKFHPEKCKILRIGKDHPTFQYTMKSNTSNELIPLITSEVEKDLGIYIDDKLSFNIHIQQAIAKANRLLGVIRRSFEYLDEEIILFLYKGLVRPTLEYGIAAWSPRLQKDIDAIEAIQRRATKMIPNLKDLPYEDRLRRLKLPTLTYRRYRGDVIHVYKYLHNTYDSPANKMFQRSDSQTRGHSLKLFKPRCRTQSRRAFFSQRVVDLWNSLPESVVNAKTLNSLKNQIDRHWNNAPFKYEYKSKFNPGTVSHAHRDRLGALDEDSPKAVNRLSS